MKRRSAGLLLTAMLLLSSVTPAWGADTATLTIAPDITQAVAGADAVEIVYTITVTPPQGKEVGVFSFQLHPSGQMTLPADFTEDGEPVIAYANSEMKYNAATGKGVFSTYEYTPAAAFFAAVGTTATRRMTAEAEIMTIRAAVPAGVSGAFVLDADFTIAPDGSGFTYETVVDSQPVIIAPAAQPSGGAAPAAARSGAVAVTGLTLPAVGQTPDTSVTVESALPAALQTTVTWLCDGGAMSGVFEAEHLYTAVLSVTATEGTFDDTVAANSGFAVERVDNTHLTLRRSFRVEEYYTETVKPEDVPPADAWPEDAPSADVPADGEAARPEEAPQARDKGGLTALVILAGLAVALGAAQLILPGGVMTLLRRRKGAQTHERR